MRKTIVKVISHIYETVKNTVEIISEFYAIIKRATVIADQVRNPMHKQMEIGFAELRFGSDFRQNDGIAVAGKK